MMKKESLQGKYAKLALKSEMYILDNTDHPCIVRVFDIFEDMHDFCII
jgi:hypothetical protein